MKHLQFLIILFVTGVLLWQCGGKGPAHDRVQRGNFTATITETGELVAVNSTTVVMPMYERWGGSRPQLTDLIEEGTLVQKGDWVGQIDTSSIANRLGQELSTLEITQADLSQIDAQQSTEMHQLESDLRSAERALRQAEIDLQRVKFESPNRQEITQLDYEIAKINYQQAQDRIEFTKIIQEQSRIIQKARVEQSLIEIDKARSTLEKFTLRAPAPGIVVHATERRRRGSEKVVVGESYHPGQPLILLPDLSKMKVLSYVNEVDIFDVYVDQPVIVRLDAFPKKQFHGHIDKIGVICRDKDRDSQQKVFDIDVMIHESDPVLRPGMTASCEIILSEQEDVLYAANEFFLQDEDQYYLLVSRGGKTVEVPVELGARNPQFSVITGDIEKGEKLINPATLGDN